MPSFIWRLAQLSGSALILIRPVLGHCKIVHVAASLDHAAGPHSHGFGVDITNKYPWYMSQGGDAGPDAPFFTPRVEYVASPVHPCGETEIWGPLDITSWLSQAEGLGVATTTPDGKFEAQIFQVNRDGGGECTCEYDTSATAKSWQKCKTLVNPPGIEGMWPADRVNHTAAFQLPSNTICQGGVFQDKCMVRIRCGWKARFGGCFAIKTPASPPKLQLKVAGAAAASMSGNSVSNIAQKIFDTMQAKGVLVPTTSRDVNKSARRAKAITKRFPSTSAVSTSFITAKADAISMKVLELMRAHRVMLLAKKAVLVAKEFEQSR